MTAMHRMICIVLRIPGFFPKLLCNEIAYQQFVLESLTIAEGSYFVGD